MAIYFVGECRETGHVMNEHKYLLLVCGGELECHILARQTAVY